MYEYNELRELFDLTEPMGWSGEVISLLKAEYGSLPAALEDYYRLCAGCDALASDQSGDYLMPAEKVGMCREDGYYVFFSENQSVSFWGIKLTDMDKPDPPVYETYDGGEWLLTGESLWRFLVSQGYLCAVTSGLEYAVEDYLEADEEQADDIRRSFEHIEYADSGIYQGAQFYRINEDSYLALMPDECGSLVMFASKSEEGFDAAEKAVLPLLDIDPEED
ncbi:hypothetical protein [uncultured Ruminococcus sp.]|uniref:hypothetical protein n=1 Tax=uncultured Ruminococcus sp. TaxID=165186 RepID=UPI0025FE857C|nr:hypothetical protein [uncultured Ruminococcus sp.]